MTVTVLRGDALDVLRDMPDQSVDAVVTDPPYGLEFMGKAWDRHDTPLGFQQWCEQWAAECLRVLKPGGHMLAFGGTRTWHRLTCAVEDAGFEIRGSIDWIYGSGFPKSLDVSKAIDKAAGAPREVVGHGSGGLHHRASVTNFSKWDVDHDAEGHPITAPATPDAVRWQGFGTALKPAHEPIVVARKPLAGTVAANVLAHGTGALNIDGTRVPAGEALVRPPVRRDGNDVLGKGLGVGVQTEPGGRWPSNIILTHAPRCGRHLTTPGGDTCRACNDPAPFDRPCQVRCVDGCPVAELDRQSGITKDGVAVKRNGVTSNGVTGWGKAPVGTSDVGYGGSGGASRFFPTFRYQAKAPTRERVKVNGVAHPTVKPVALMQWLVRLVTPPGGVVLDPFAGSGTTAEAAHLEGFDSILIENHDPYFPLIAARLERCGAIADSPHPDEEETA